MSRRRTALLIVALGLALFLPGIASRDLWNPDEPRYAEVAREMRDARVWSVPRLNGAIYSEKPPLLFWAIRGVAAVTGEVDLVAARLPSILAAIAAMLAVFELGRRLFDLPTAWIATAVFATSARILWQGRIGQIDMLLVALVAWAVVCWLRGFQGEGARWYRGFFLLAGLATIAKGPVGLLPPLLSIVVFLLATRRRAELSALRVPTGLALWALVVLAWFVPAVVAAGGGYLETMLLKQNVTRYADPWHHYQPWYYYLTVVPGDFFPWSFFLPGAVVLGWRRLRDERRTGLLFALAWAATTLVFFSLSPAKRTVYVLTMYPALALAVAAAFEEIRRSLPDLKRWLVVPFAAVALLAAVAAPLAIVLADGRPELAPMGADLPYLVAGLAAALSVAAAAAWRYAARLRSRRAVTALAVGMAVVALLAVTLVVPRFDTVKSTRALTETYLALSTPMEPYAIWPRLDATILFHARRFAVVPRDAEEIAAFAARPGRVFLFVRRDAWERLAERPPLFEIARDLDLGKGYLLLTNRLADPEE